MKREQRQQWHEVRAHYPETWVLVEAIQAHSEANTRIIKEVALLDTFADSVSAMKNISNYITMHRSASSMSCIPAVNRSIFRNDDG